VARVEDVQIFLKDPVVLNTYVYITDSTYGMWDPRHKNTYFCSLQLHLLHMPKYWQ